MPEHNLNGKEVRYIRITFLGSDNGFWGSIREIEVTDGELNDPLIKEWEKVREAEEASGIELFYYLDV